MRLAKRSAGPGSGPRSAGARRARRPRRGRASRASRRWGPARRVRSSSPCRTDPLRIAVRADRVDCPQRGCDGEDQEAHGGAVRTSVRSELPPAPRWRDHGRAANRRGRARRERMGRRSGPCRSHLADVPRRNDRSRRQRRGHDEGGVQDALALAELQPAGASREPRRGSYGEVADEAPGIREKRRGATRHVLFRRGLPSRHAEGRSAEPLQGTPLRDHGGGAVHGGAPRAGTSDRSVRDDDLRDLERQLARRGRHSRADRLVLLRGPRFLRLRQLAQGQPHGLEGLPVRVLSGSSRSSRHPLHSQAGPGEILGGGQAQRHRLVGERTVGGQSNVGWSRGPAPRWSDFRCEALRLHRRGGHAGAEREVRLERLSGRHAGERGTARGVRVPGERYPRTDVRVTPRQEEGRTGEQQARHCPAPARVAGGHRLFC